MRRGAPREGGHGDEVRAGREGGPGPEAGQGGAGEEAEGGHQGGGPPGAAREPAGAGQGPSAAALRGQGTILSVVLEILLRACLFSVNTEESTSSGCVSSGRRGQQVDQRRGEAEGGDQLASHQGQMGSEQTEERGRRTQGNTMEHTFIF